MGTNITGIGNANAIGFKSRVTGGMYFPPELKDALVGVWSAYGKSNDSTDRNIIKNKIKDRGGDFVISNVAFKLNSGFGKYSADFESFDWAVDISQKQHNKATISLNGRLCNHAAIEVDEMKVNIIGNVTELIYWYIANPDDTTRSEIRLTSGINTLPKSYAKDDGQTYNIGFAYISGDSEITIEQIPSFQGAVVTDGVDDLITSTKTLGEMIGDSNDLTVISMIHQISPIQSDNFAVRNRVKNYDKTGIYGYSVSNLSSSSNINTILGDKEDYITQIVTSSSNKNNVFSVEGFLSVGDGIIAETSQVAWYWTFIAKRVLTEDEINLVIEKYNLDRPGEIVKPDVYYDVKRQKITNENHSSFNNELVDFSGNGHNMKLYNLAWKGGSGIAAKPYETFKDWYGTSSSTSIITEIDEFTRIVDSTTNGYWVSRIRRDSDLDKIYDAITIYLYQDDNTLIHKCKYKVDGVDKTIAIYERVGKGYHQLEIYSKDRYTGLPENAENIILSEWYYPRSSKGSIKYSIIPSYKGGILLDGVDDYGQYVGDLGLKDYTVAMDRAYVEFKPTQVPLISEITSNTLTPFIFEHGQSIDSISALSFGSFSKPTKNMGIDRVISYQSTYSYNGVAITKGTNTNTGKGLTIGRYGTSILYTNMVLWSMLLFPYSLSEFLLERQIKKARAGTLYPNQVEFRPIIPEDENITRIDYFVVNSGTWTVIKPGDYVDVGARIVFNVYTKLPYKVEKVSSPAFTGMSVGPSTGLNIFDVKGYIKDKTPQKIKLTLAVNEDIVQWNPTITSNLLDSFTVSSWYLNGWDNTLTEGTWIKKTDRVFFKTTFKTELYGLETATFGGAECVVSKADNWSDSINIWDIRMLGTVGDLSQVFNLDVYELIRFEDIVQPYPSFVRLENLDRTHTYTWGDKLKVGDTIRYNSSKNLLEGAYTLKGQLECNGVYVYENNQHITVAKEMIFAWTNSPVWSIDDNEPKCVLSPDRLQIPNSSYRILGHIPDISGHGNHGEINNSAYTGMSGANGYKQDFTSWKTNGSRYSIVTDTKYILTNEKAITNAGYFLWNRLAKDSFKVKISNIPSGGWMSYRYKITEEDTQVSSLFIREDGIYTLPATIADSEVDFFISTVSAPAEDWIGLTIEQIGEYEGAYCLDGVDDFIINKRVRGGKQVLMKCNWWSTVGTSILYDQRGYDNEFAIFNADSNSGASDIFIAYSARHNGNTYIDGILNSNIHCKKLIGLTHNITCTNELNAGSNKATIRLGCNNGLQYFTQMALYDFMLFDEISTDDKIKELNEYIGIEENVFAINPNISIDTPEAVKDIKIYRGGKEISSGYLYLNKDTEFEIYVSLNTGKYSLDTITMDGVEITKDRVVGEYNIFKFTLNGSSEQNITIHSYEYIMYEDIVQPYPVLLRFNDKNGNEVSWGGKFKVGSTITRIGSIAGPESNLLNGLYSISGLSLNGKAVTSSTSIVEKQMVFRTTATWLLGDNEPKCIFSPSKLRMPNESYRYLGYIPDISGNGNNGVFNNFAFGGMSGVDGYPFNFRTITVLVKKVSFTDDTLVINRTSTSDQTWALNLGKQSEPFDLYVNWEDDSTRLLVWAKSGIIVSQYTLNKEWNSIPVVTDDYDYMYLSYVNPSTLGKTTIKQKAKYEGSICFDGVDDYIKIDTTGGMTMLMKANVMSTTDRILYDQRDINSSNNLYKEFAILTSNSNDILAYAGRHTGTTYIDGVLNTNITCGQLLNITHTITAITKSNLVGTEQGVRIGASATPASYCKAAVFDFMLFDAKCTDDEVKQLNDIIGIEGDYVQKPSYYWDAYGKTNFDIDKDIIPQRGTEKGYNFASFDNTTEWQLVDNTFVNVSRDGYKAIVTVKGENSAANSWKFRNIAYTKYMTDNIPFKVRANKRISVFWSAEANRISNNNDIASRQITSVELIPNEDTLIILGNMTEEELIAADMDKNSTHYQLNFSYSNLAVDEEVTIEMLPVEGGKSLALTNNNFAYDKMSGYGGYSFSSFNNVSDWAVRAGGSGLEVISRDGYSIAFKKLAQGLDWDVSNNEYRYPIILNKELPFKCRSNKNVGLIWQLKYRTEGATTDSTITLLNQQLTPNVPLEVNLPYKTQDELTELGAIPTSIYYLLYFSNTTLEIGEEYIVEMLPLYPNGLVFDGVDDYSENASIPLLSDYTYIFKRTLLNKKYNSASIFKGSNQQSGGGAFICDYNSVEPDLLTQGYSFGAGLYVDSLNADSIVYGTRGSVNGTKITAGNNTDTEGLTVGKWRAYKEMVFYKLFLYPRTVNMLSINMVKNMMEEDGIIDLTSKLFTDKYTGDFYEMDFNNDFLIGN